MRTIYLLLSGLMLSGCLSSLPLNISEEDWALLSEEQKLEAYKQQSVIDQKRYESSLKADEQERQAELARLAQIEHIRQRADYGDRIYCIFDPVRLKQGKRWNEIRPTAAELFRGEFQEVELFPYVSGYTDSLWLEFDQAGNRVWICRSQSALNGRHYGCDALVGTFSDFSRGTGKTLRIDDRINGELRCSYTGREKYRR